MASDSDSCSDVFDQLKDAETAFITDHSNLAPYHSGSFGVSAPYPTISSHIMFDENCDFENDLTQLQHTIDEPSESMEHFSSPITEPSPGSVASTFQPLREFSSSSLAESGNCAASPSSAQSVKNFVHPCSEKGHSSPESFAAPEVTGVLAEDGAISPQSSGDRVSFDKRDPVRTPPKFITGSPPVILPTTKPAKSHEELAGKSTDFPENNDEELSLPAQNPQGGDGTSSKSIFYPKGNFQTKSSTLPLQTPKKTMSWNEYASKSRNTKYDWEPQTNPYYSAQSYQYEESSTGRDVSRGRSSRPPSKPQSYVESSKTFTSRTRRERRRPPAWNEDGRSSPGYSYGPNSQTSAYYQDSYHDQSPAKAGDANYYVTRPKNGRVFNRSDHSPQHQSRPGTGGSQRSDTGSYNSQTAGVPQPTRNMTGCESYPSWSARPGAYTRIYHSPVPNQQFRSPYRQPIMTWRHTGIPHPVRYPAHIRPQFHPRPEGPQKSIVPPSPAVEPKSEISLSPPDFPPLSKRESPPRPEPSNSGSASPPNVTLSESSSTLDSATVRSSPSHCRTGSTASQSSKNCASCRAKKAAQSGSNSPVSAVSPSHSASCLLVPSVPPSVVYAVPQYTHPVVLPEPDPMPPSFLAELVYPEGKVRRARLLDQRLNDMLRSRMETRPAGSMGQTAWFANPTVRNNIALMAAQQI